MPPRVREVAARLIGMGFVLERRGKGDHSIYRHPVTGDVVVLDGGPNHELPKPVWHKLQKRFGWRDE
jgi:predicted RNA binding protein YcfA (HicA-like mRNA interferase family)